MIVVEGTILYGVREKLSGILLKMLSRVTKN